MSVSLHRLISVTVLLGLGSCEPVFDITDPAFIEECVRGHNKHRAAVKPAAANMRYMVNIRCFLIRDQLVSVKSVEVKHANEC